MLEPPSPRRPIRDGQAPRFRAVEVIEFPPPLDLFFFDRARSVLLSGWTDHCLGHSRATPPKSPDDRRPALHPGTGLQHRCLVLIGRAKGKNPAHPAHAPRAASGKIRRANVAIELGAGVLLLSKIAQFGRGQPSACAPQSDPGTVPRTSLGNPPRIIFVHGTIKDPQRAGEIDVRSINSH